MIYRKVILGWAFAMAAAFVASGAAQARELPDFTDIVTNTAPADPETSNTGPDHPE